jgi:purine-nucleoside phosphorylase
VNVGNVLSSDQFYHPRPEVYEVAQRMGLLAAEMEAAGLYAVAAERGVRAAAILTVSDILGSDEEMPSQDRQTSLDEMITIALESAVRTEGRTNH